MSYVEILKKRIADGEITMQQAFEWLCEYEMDPIKAWDGLNG